MTSDQRGSDSRDVGPLGKVVVRGVALNASGYVLTQAITFASGILLARLASPEDFGVYASATILLGYTGMLVDSGMAAALIQREDRVEEAASTALAANLVSGFLVAAGVAASAPLLGIYFQSQTVELVALVMAGVVLLDALVLVPDALLQRRFSFYRRLVLSPSYALTYGVAAGIACGFGLGVWGLVIGRYASLAAEVVLIWALVGWRPRRDHVSIAMWRALVRFGRHIFAQSFLTQLRYTIRTALLGRFVSIDAVGQYRMAEMISNLPREAWLASSAYVLFPAFARISRDRERLNAALLRAMRWMAIVTLPASALLLPLGPAVAVLLLGERWRPAGYALMALAAIPLAGGVNSVLSEAVKGAGRPEMLSRTGLFMAIVAPVLLVGLVPLGLVGIAAAGSIATLAGTAFLARLATKALDVPLSAILATLRPAGLATCALLAALFPLQWLAIRAETHGTVVGLGLLGAEAVLGTAVYVATLRALDPQAVATIAGAARLGWTRLAGELGRSAPGSG
jgi:PST family polysaccharide transporter